MLYTITLIDKQFGDRIELRKALHDGDIVLDIIKRNENVMAIIVSHVNECGEYNIKAEFSELKGTKFYDYSSELLVLARNLYHERCRKQEAILALLDKITI